jgi:fumarylacetoacetase
MSLLLNSWVEGANDPAADFTLANLPFGVFDAGDGARIGVPIGDQVLDIAAAMDAGLLPDEPALRSSTLNAFAGLGTAARCSLRERLQAVLGSSDGDRSAPLVALADIQAKLPFSIGDYTDFYASEHHATNVGRMFRPDGDPLLPNWKHLPVGYHGRASSIVPSGTAIKRPWGQTVGPDGPPPKHQKSRLLDYELEVGFFIGQKTEMGEPVKISEALSTVFGLVLVNDWSARDIQKWEYQPLGPFNAKNFGTSISPWVVTIEALEPFMVDTSGREKHPDRLNYLDHGSDVHLDVTLEVSIRSAAMRENNMAPTVLSTGSYLDMYWSIAQMIAHHTSTGCNLNPGDMMASGTVSGPGEESRGCLLELTWRGEKPIKIGDDTERKFLQDGDELTIRGWCDNGKADRIGFGTCSGIVLPANE